MPSLLLPHSGPHPSTCAKLSQLFSPLLLKVTISLAGEDNQCAQFSSTFSVFLLTYWQKNRQQIDTLFIVYQICLHTSIQQIVEEKYVDVFNTSMSTYWPFSSVSLRMCYNTL